MPFGLGFEGRLPLCSACQKFQPQRADASIGDLPEEVRGRGRETDAMGEIIRRCVLCDLHGFFVQRPTIHRQSTIEFGWVVSVREKFHRDLHLHARHAIGSQEETTSEGEVLEEEASGEREAEVTAQMVYHRPTRSGIYAFVTLFQAWRIGLNEVNYTYALGNDDERKERFDLALTAYEWTFKRPDGAMTTTRLPHIEGVEGLVLVAKTAVPVPLLSPLCDDYRQKLKELAERQGVEAHEFDDLLRLTEILTDLRQLSPFKLSDSSQQ
jgi:CRISPR-associated protein Cst2